MGTYQRGFTIIEVMLFLAISAALVVALMGGWSLSVNTQSYKDSITSLKTKLQEQYTNTLAVQNDRNGTLNCTVNGVGMIAVSTRGVAYARGASNCIMLGRYISANRGTLTIEPILGFNLTTPPASNATIEQVFRDYDATEISNNISGSGLTPETYTIPWSASTRPKQFSMAVMQSPTTGIVYTYTASSIESLGKLLQTSQANQTGLTLCIEPNTLVAMGVQAVAVAKDASSQSGVSQLGDGGNNGC